MRVSLTERHGVRSLPTSTHEFGFQRCHALRCDYFLIANAANSFTRFGFDADLRRMNADDLGNTNANRVLERRELRSLRENNAIQISDCVVGSDHSLNRLAQHIRRIPPPIGLIRVGKHFANITERRCAQKSIRDRMQRLKTESNRSSPPAFGALTADEWEKVHCRHSELHLS